MNMRAISVTLTLALTASGCGEVLRTPDVAIDASQVVGEELVYDITALRVTPEVVASANAMPFLAQVTVGESGQGVASRVSVEEAIGRRLPGAGARPAYMIGGGDILRVTRTINIVEGAGLEAEQAEVNELRVGEDGYIDLTDAGRVLVGGKSNSQAQDAISTAYVARSPNEGSRVSEVEFPSGGEVDYLIGTGDILSLSFIMASVSLAGDVSNSVVSTSSPVGPDGVATFLQVGPVDVGGQSISEAQSSVSQAALRSNAATDQVQLNVVEFRSQSIIVSGDVQTSIVQLRPLANTYDNVLASSGLLLNPSSDYLVTLERAGTKYQMRASSILSGTNRGRFVARDGDRIDVRLLAATPDFRVNVSAFNTHKVTFLDTGTGSLAVDDTGTGSPAVLSLTDEGLELRTLLLSRGVTVTRDVDVAVRLVRGGSEYRISARDLMIEDPSRKVWLQPGDNVIVEPLEYVPSQAVIVGQVGAPQPFPIDQAARSTVSRALFSGGLFSTPSADFRHIYVLRKQEAAKYDAYHFDLTEVLNIGLSDRMELRPGDVIFVRTNPIVKLGTFIDLLLCLGSRVSAVSDRL
jgi:protein involved in polysaccharide export with SLBB domain